MAAMMAGITVDIGNDSSSTLSTSFSTELAGDNTGLGTSNKTLPFVSISLTGNVGLIGLTGRVSKELSEAMRGSSGAAGIDNILGENED